MNRIENMWSEVKRTMQETWPVLPPRNSDELWALVSDAWDEVALSTHYIRSLCFDIYKLMSENLPLFYLSINSGESSHETFNIKRDLDCRWEMLLDLHPWNVVLKLTH